MQNCLIETLNGSVDYKEFPKIGHLKVKVTDTASLNETNSYIRVAYDDVAANAEILGDGYFMRTFGGESKGDIQEAEKFGEVYEMRDVYVSNGSFDIEYSDKYNIRVLMARPGRRFHFNIDDLKYSNNLRYLEASSNNVEGNISSLAGKSNLINVLLDYSTGYKIEGNTSVFKEGSFPLLTKISFEASNVMGDIADFGDCTSLQTLSVCFTDVGGDISSLGKLTKLSVLSFSDKNTGSIESFVNAQRANGRVSCTGISSTYLYNALGLTFNGTPLINTVGTEVTSKISWTETTITIKDTTITA